MQTKSVPSILTSSRDRAGSANPPMLGFTVGKTPRSVQFSALAARRKCVQDRQVSLALLGGDLEVAARPELTRGAVEQSLAGTARLLAELLELAEEASDGTRTGTMRSLADLCFDGILRLDAARQGLGGSAFSDPAGQRKQRRAALRDARALLTELDLELARTLAD